jgi:shikimate kinase
MGAGKSTVGRRIARQLGWPFVDNDERLVAIAGRPAREIARAEGAERLHALEAEALLGALAEPGPSVIAAAASTVEDARCRASLTAPGVAVVWLRGSPAALAARQGEGKHRPELGPDPARQLEAQIARRDALFASLGPIEIDTAGQTVDQLVERILARLGTGDRS